MKKKNQWQIKSIEGVRRVKSPRISKRLLTSKPLAEPISTKPSIGRLVSQVAKGGLTVLVSVVIIFTAVKAGSLTPSSVPASDGYTLGNIYTRLTDNTASISSGGFSMDPSGSPAGTQYTLDQIYSAVPTINPSKLLSDTTYLGVTGSIATQTLSVLNDTVAAGYYVATTLSAVDTDLAAANILSGKTIFGFDGTIIPDPTYGDNDATKVLNTASNPGTYDPNTCSTTYDTSNLTVGTVKSGTAFGDSLTGEYPSADYLLLNADGGITDLASSGINITSFNGAVEWWQSDGTRQTAILDFPTLSNVCSNDASNNSAGTLTIDGSKILSGTTYCDTNGSIVNCSSEGSQSCYATGTYFAGTSKTPSNSATSQSAGYYPVFDLATVDTDLVDSNILSGVNIFGVAGDSNVVNTSTGDATAGDIASGAIAWVDGAEVTGTFDPWTLQSLATIDDRSAVYTGEEAIWEAIGTFGIADTTLLSGEVKKDLRTGLWWSDRSDAQLSNSFANATDGVRPTGGNSIAFCNTLNSAGTTGFGGYANWYLPTQKELQQAYIDGSNHNLPSPGNYFWSSTEDYGYPDYAWTVTLNYGHTSSNTKTTASYVRCVRR